MGLMRLEGKTAFITGGGGGIGRALVLAFLKEGAQVLICGRGEARLRQAEKAAAPWAERFSFLTGDISNRDDCRRMADWMARRWGRLDVLVNNAGILGPRAPLSDYPPEEWEAVIRINLCGVFFITQAVLPLMRKGTAGSIINLSSSVGRKGRALWGAYSASKFGVESLTQTLAEELSPFGIRVNSVNPGGTLTEMRRLAYPEEDPAALPTPEAILPVFLYLASDESKGVSGQALNARDWL